MQALLLQLCFPEDIVTYSCTENSASLCVCEKVIHACCKVQLLSSSHEKMVSERCPCVHVRSSYTQELWEWSRAQALYTAAISLGGFVQGLGTRVARVGGRCAVVWLASEWHRVVCAVCVLHMVLKVAPSSCIRSQSLIALLRFCCFGIHPLSPFSPSPPHRSSFC